MVSCIWFVLSSGEFSLRMFPAFFSPSVLISWSAQENVYFSFGFLGNIYHTLSYLVMLFWRDLSWTFVP